MSVHLKNNPAFELKGSLLTLTVLRLLSADMQALVTQLRYNAQTTPNLFKNMPVLVDLQSIKEHEDAIDFLALQQHLREYGLISVGVRNGSEPLNQSAQAAGLPILANQSTPVKTTETSAFQPRSEITHNRTMLITKPIRSGQQVYAKNADLVIIAQVSAGAEILADGSIHVYDVLRGRALAGVNGDKQANIFCHKLEADLISIAGHYQLNEGMPTISAPMIRAHLEGEKICVTGLPGGR